MNSSPELRKLFEIDSDGYLAWKECDATHPFEDPIRFLLRAHPLEPHDVINTEGFDLPNSMQQIGERLYSIQDENTGYRGLLRMTDLFPEFPNRSFEQVLMVGCISHYGLEVLIEWLKLHNSETAEITIVDTSKSIINLLFFLYQQGFFHTDNKISFVVQDVVEYSPNKQFDLVITDVLLPYTFEDQYVVTREPQISDYANYSAIISHIESLLSINGCFLSRTFHDETFTPTEISTPIKDITLEDIQNARIKIAKLLGTDLEKQIIDDQIINALGYPWNKAITQHGCGIEHLLNTHYHLLGNASVPIIDQIMEEAFPGSSSSRIDVVSSQPNWTFHSYCGIKREN